MSVTRLRMGRRRLANRAEIQPISPPRHRQENAVNAAPMNSTMATSAISTAVAAMTTENSASGAGLDAYRARVSVFYFMLAWCKLILVTLLNRPRFSHLLGVFTLGTGPVRVEGLHNLPQQGSFVLAVNHFGGAGTMRVLALILQSMQERRADAVDELLIVTGRRQSIDVSARGLRSLMRKLVGWGFGRWRENVLRISLDDGGQSQSVASLRQWRKLAACKPSLVFPEGQARLTFGEIRHGAGLFLRSLDVPVIPVAAYFADGQWTIAFGKQVRWCKRLELSDAQIGLSIARLLPAPLTPVWNKALAR